MLGLGLGPEKGQRKMRQKSEKNRKNAAMRDKNPRRTGASDSRVWRANGDRSGDERARVARARCAMADGNGAVGWLRAARTDRTDLARESTRRHIGATESRAICATFALWCQPLQDALECAQQWRS